MGAAEYETHRTFIGPGVCLRRKAARGGHGRRFTGPWWHRFLRKRSDGRVSSSGHVQLAPNLYLRRCLARWYNSLTLSLLPREINGLDHWTIARGQEKQQRCRYGCRGWWGWCCYARRRGGQKWRSK